MNYKFLFLVLLVLLTSFNKGIIKTNSIEKNEFSLNNKNSFNKSIYDRINLNSNELPSFEVFNIAMNGYQILEEKGLVKKPILTLIDFSLSSNLKRLWVIDLENNSILFQSLVAHGRETGEEFANEFSNQFESFKSSLGFYTTGEAYQGKHGLSLRLDGLEKGLNDNARDRAVVVHGADYVSESFIKQNKRLGRSLGCPAVPMEINEKLIEIIKEKSCLFIYHPSKKGEIISKLAV